MSLTDPVFFDTDCISAFLWVNGESIITKLYAGRIVIPIQVYKELSHPGVNHLKGLKAQVDALINNEQACVESITAGTETYEVFYKLTQHPDSGHKLIGAGEAAAIALAKECGGILASNNLKDIMVYVREYALRHITTGDIMKEALGAGLISEQQGDAIWQNMLKRKRRLGYASFSEYLKGNS